MYYFSQKISSKEQPEQALAFSFIIYYQQKSTTISVIIDWGAIDNFLTNKDWITNYRDHQHVFEIGSGEKVTTYDYRHVILQHQSLDGIINTLTVSNFGLASDLCHHFLSTIFLTKKGIKIFLRTSGGPSEIFFETRVVRLVDLFDNQYFILLSKSTVPNTNFVNDFTFEILHTRLGHLNYWVVQKLASVVLGIELKSLLPSEIFGGCMVCW